MCVKYSNGDVGRNQEVAAGFPARHSLGDGGSLRDAALDSAMSNYDFKAYLDVVFDVVDEANEEVDKKEPFKLVKQDAAAANRVLSRIAEQICWIGTALAPVLPQTSEEILKRYGTIITNGDALFPRRDTERG